MKLTFNDGGLHTQTAQHQEGQQSFFELISADESATLRVIMQITSGIQNIVDKVQTLLLYWEKKYKHMWDQDKDAYIRQVSTTLFH